MPALRQLNDDLLHVLDDIGEHGALDTLMVFERHADGRTLRAVQMQLQGLENEGYLHGVQLTVSTATVIKGRKKRTTRRQPTVFTLTPKGGDVVEQYCGERPPRVQRSEPSPETLLHRMTVVRTRLAFDRSCRAAGLTAPAWIHESDIRAQPNEKTPPNQRSRLFHRYETDSEQTVACRFDAACRVLLPAPTAESGDCPTAVIFGWEIDLSSEGRKQLRATKPAAIEAWLRKQSYREYWPDTNHLPTKVRIAWTVPSSKRIDGIAATTDNPALLATYRFLVQEDVQKRDLVLDAVWRTASGMKLPLYVPDTSSVRSTTMSAVENERA